MFWDNLLREMGVDTVTLPVNYIAPPPPVSPYVMKTYNVGEVIVGEIVEEQGELTTGGKSASL